MTRYFAQNTPRAGLEHMMMSVPGFQKRGGGMMILSRFCYKPEDVDCRYCLHYRRRSCQVRTCPYIAERLKSGAIEYGLIRRKDGQPLPVFQPEQEIGQGLEMM